MSGARRRYIVTASATRDLAQIRSYLLPKSPAGWISLRTKLRQAMDQLAAYPGTGHLREDLTDSGLRLWNVGSYVIVYVSDVRPVEIVRILHTARDVGRFI